MSMSVAGPGPYSKRTDQPKRALPDAGYGEQADFQAIQSGAPMAATPNVVPLTDPTQRPTEPVTAGSPLGPGSGPAPAGPSMSQDTQALAKYLPLLQAQAKDPNVAPSFKSFVRFIEGSLNQ